MSETPPPSTHSASGGFVAVANRSPQGPGVEGASNGSPQGENACRWEPRGGSQTPPSDGGRSLLVVATAIEGVEQCADGY